VSLFFRQRGAINAGIMKTKSEVAQLQLTGLAVVEQRNGGADMAEQKRTAHVVAGGSNNGMHRTTVSRTPKTGLPVASAAPGIRKFSKAKSVAAQLGICPRTIFRWADAGKIARHKVNARVVLFDEMEIATFIESARVQSKISS
jgi:hypothetical protein